jgi:hypothetical protein
VLARTDGVTASFLKELLRRAALVSVEGAGEPLAREADASAITISADQLDVALDELMDNSNLMTRALLGASPALERGSLDDDR